MKVSLDTQGECKNEWPSTWPAISRWEIGWAKDAMRRIIWAGFPGRLSHASLFHRGFHVTGATVENIGISGAAQPHPLAARNRNHSRSNPEMSATT